MKKNGFSLIEILVVIAIFALIIAVVSSAITSSMVGIRKSDNTVSVRENMSLALGLVERKLRSARGVTACTETAIDFISENNRLFRVFCNPSQVCDSTTSTSISITEDGLTSRLTNLDTICITACEFICTPPPSPGPTKSVKIFLEGSDKETTGAENSRVRLETTVSLRAY